MNFAGRIKKFTLLMLLVSLAAFTGCRSLETSPFSLSLLGLEIIPPIHTYTAARSVENRSIRCSVFGSGCDITLFIATIHGNEQAGTPLVKKLSSYLRKNSHLLKTRQIIIIHAANPDGRKHNYRHNVNGIDLNRNFEAENRINNPEFGQTPLSEPESIMLKNLIDRYQPDRIVTLHQAANCIDYDGPAETIAKHMGRYCRLPVRKIGAQPGSLGSYAGLTLQIPIITLEMTEPIGTTNFDSRLLWQKYGKSLIAACLYPDPPE